MAAEEKAEAEAEAEAATGAGAGAETEPDAAPSTLDTSVRERIEAIENRVITQRNAEIHGLFEILGSKRRLLLVNFMAGLSRGAGFFLGATLIGALLLGGVAMFIDTAAQAVGLKDVSFQSLIYDLAEKATEAQQVWEDVKEDQTKGPIMEPATPPDEDADSAIRKDEGVSPPPPRDG